jgi:hypothetical protein
MLWLALETYERGQGRASEGSTRERSRHSGTGANIQAGKHTASINGSLFVVLVHQKWTSDIHGTLLPRVIS